MQINSNQSKRGIIHVQFRSRVAEIFLSCSYVRLMDDVRLYLLSRRKAKAYNCTRRIFYLLTKGILKRGNKSTQARIYMGEKHKVDGNCCKA